jgi:predicted GNAT family acetyltransferase
MYYGQEVATAETTVRLVHNLQESRYEGWLGDELAGFAQYQLTPELIVFNHTETDPKFAGKGIGSTIVRFALDDVRGAGTHKVMPLCSFVKSWIDHHPDYCNLLLS